MNLLSVAAGAEEAKNVERKLMKARTHLLLNQPFFGTLCLRLKLSPGPVPTMATDGRRILYNPAFVDSLKPAEIEGVLAHEVMHVALAHHCRRGDRQRRIWNEAADYAINPILIGNGFMLPEGALVESSFSNLSAEEIYAQLMNRRVGDEGCAPQSSSQPHTGSGAGPEPGSPSPSTPDVQASDPSEDPGPGNTQDTSQSSEEDDEATDDDNSASSSLPASNTNNAAGQKPNGPASSTSDSQGSGPTDQSEPQQVSQPSEEYDECGDRGLSEERPGGFGEVLDATNEDGNPASPAEKSRQEQEWAIFADQAIRSARMCGLEPANLARPLEENRESKQDWRAILRDFIAATTPSDYRWTPPNRRYISRGLYLPSVERTGVGRIVIAVDTSGSIGMHELEQFGGEISAIADEAKPESIHVVYCDAAVQSAEEFLPSSDPIQLSPQGGGGTDFVPVFRWVAENGINPVCLIYLTDLCCFSYPDEPDYPVLWVTNSRRTAPFGETVRIGFP